MEIMKSMKLELKDRNRYHKNKNMPMKSPKKIRSKSQDKVAEATDQLKHIKD